MLDVAHPFSQQIVETARVPSVWYGQKKEKRSRVACEERRAASYENLIGSFVFPARSNLRSEESSTLHTQELS